LYRARAANGGLARFRSEAKVLRILSGDAFAAGKLQKAGMGLEPFAPGKVLIAMAGSLDAARRYSHATPRSLSPSCSWRRALP
jgi:hypothetical protein